MRTNSEVDVSVSRGQRRAYRALAVAVSVCAALLVWVIASAGEVGLELTSPAIGTLRIGAVLVVASALPLALAAWGALALAERFTRRPRRVWTAVAIAVLLLSLPPLLFLEATDATKLTLAVMHAVTGVVLIAMLGRSARPTR